MSPCSTDGLIRLLIDASGFAGWDRLAAVEAHACFIKSDQVHVERLAVIFGHGWRRRLINKSRLVPHTEACALDKDREKEALDWIR